MNNNNLIGIVAGLVTVVILLGALTAPTIAGFTDEKKTYYNDGVPYTVADANDTDTHTILISLVDEEYVITLDGEEIDDSYFGSSQYTLIFGEHSIIRYAPSTGRVSVGGTASSESTTQLWKNFDAPTDGNPVTITIIGTTATVVGLQSASSTTYSISENFAYVSIEGDYRYSYTPCVTSDSVIYGGGVTYSPFSGATVICFSGTIENISAGIYRSSPTATLDSVTVNTTAVSSNLVRIDSIVFDCTQSDTSVSATYTYFLAPYAIEYDNPDYLGAAAAALFAPVIVILIVAMIFVIGRFFGRDD